MLALSLFVGCGDDDAENEGPDEDTQGFGCVFESRLLDSCNNPEGSPWAESCVDVLVEEDCLLATEEMNEEVGECTFTTTYRNVQTTPGRAALNWRTRGVGGLWRSSPPNSGSRART